MAHCKCINFVPWLNVNDYANEYKHYVYQLAKQENYMSLKLALLNKKECQDELIGCNTQ